MKIKLMLIIFVISSVILYSETNIYYGPVSGTWTAAESPFLIHAEINIPNNQTLTIEPGVIISFQGPYKFIVYGKLLAEGTLNDSIIFTAENEYTGWKGLRFTNTNYNGLGTGKIDYCLFENGNTDSGTNPNNKGGALICLNSSNLLVQNSAFTNNKSNYGGAIALSNSSPTFHGLTIEDNYASHDGGGIIIAYNSNPTVNNTSITNNSCFCDGGGVFVSGNSAPEFDNVSIVQNTALGEYDCGGGGMTVWGANPILTDCTINNNTSVIAGGIYCLDNSVLEINNTIISRNNGSIGGAIMGYNCDLELTGTSIFYNNAQNVAGGIYLYNNSSITFDPDNRCSIYSNTAINNNDYGQDICIDTNINVDVILDTFTVLNPDSLYAYPLANFTFDILHGKFQPASQDLYVSTIGSNQNSGLTPQEPLQSITQAVQMIQPDSLNPLIIHIEDGIYSPSQTDEILPLIMKSYLTLQGTSKLNTIIDAENSAGIFRLVALSEVNINDLTITNAYETGYICGGGINLLYSELSLKDIVIKNCHSINEAGGISLSSSSILNLSGTSIFHNSSGGQAGAISHDYGSPIINFDPVNLCSIYLNDSYYGYEIEWHESPINVIVDTFTVLNPDETIVTPFSYFTFEISNAIYEPVAADLYVSPDGSNDNSGLTPTEPLKTIDRALRMIITTENDPYTIYLAEGTYSPSINEEVFPITVDDYVSISGISRENTILDAEQTNRVLRIIGDHVSIENISVCNGQESFGAGIYIQGDHAFLQNMIVKDNFATSQSYNNTGGGIYCNGENTILENLIICDNIAADRGGGIYFDLSAYLSGVTIKNNIAINDQGGGVFCNYQPVVFDSLNLCNIMNNHSLATPSFGNDIYYEYDSYFSDTLYVIVDTFTVINPTNYYSYPTNVIEFDILNSYYPQIDADVYVSPSGSNNNSGLTPDAPWKSISFALQRTVSDSLEPNIIHLLEGTYSPIINGEIFPLFAADHIEIAGISKENTILDGANSYPIIHCDNISGFSIEECTLRNGSASGYPNTKGGAIYSHQSSLMISNSNLHSNYASYHGGAIYCNESDLNLDNSYIYNNISSNGNGIYCKNSSLLIINSNICFNESEWGSALEFNTNDWNSSSHSAILVNNIFWGNEPHQICVNGSNNSTAILTVTNSDIEGGYDEIITYDDFIINWLDGNIDENPMFGEVENEFFMLQPDSPCIDAGTAYFEWEDEVLLDMQPDEYLGPAPDIGAWESEYFTGTDIPAVSLVFSLHQNYPNPFNPDTNILYSLPVDCNVNISIYNVKGQKVKTLVKEKQEKGHHSIEWNGKNNFGKSVTSGIYFYKIKAEVNGKNKFTKVYKMMMLK